MTESEMVYHAIIEATNQFVAQGRHLDVAEAIAQEIDKLQANARWEYSITWEHTTVLGSVFAAMGEQRWELVSLGEAGDENKFESPLRLVVMKRRKLP